MASLAGASGCRGFIQKSSPNQKLYECRTSDKDRAIAKPIQSRIFKLIENRVKSGINSDNRNIVTTHPVVAA